MKGIRWVAVVGLCLMPSLIEADTIHLKNGKTVEGKILSREADRVWLETKAGRIPLPLARVAAPEGNALEAAREALAGGDHKRALMLAEIVHFWEPENAEAGDLMQRARSALDLAERGKAVSDLETAAARTYEDLSARLDNAVAEAATPGDTERRVLEIEAELRAAAVTYAGSSKAKAFESLAVAAAEMAVEAHEDKIAHDAEEAERREMEVRQSRAQAQGLKDFNARVGTISSGGKSVVLEELMIPGGIVIFEFYADSCEPCAELAPALRKFAMENPGVYLRRVDILSATMPVAKQFGLETIPSVWVYDGGGKLVDSRMNEMKPIIDAVRRAESPAAAAPEPGDTGTAAP